ncbi:hypothetical protein GCK32_008235 [Trichostrongylus colubriformis]|uniref:Uncharacterized protein n=1 Tax=Trichostrongylus colubriformis TaxID=6319 RepID=A0AAN8FIM4_TRICO
MPSCLVACIISATPLPVSLAACERSHALPAVIMSDQCSGNPQNVEECNLVMEALLSKVANQMNFEILLRGQEDILTLSEYEALFAAEMKICESALDVVLELARKQKAYLEALVAQKRIERALPSTIANAFKQVATEANKVSDLRKRLEEGEYSFFVSAYAKGDDGTDTTSVNCVINGLSNTQSNVPSYGNTVFSTSCSRTEFPSTVRLRERPQFSSDAARRILDELETVKKKAPTKTEFETRVSSVQSEQKPTKSNSQDCSVERQYGDERIHNKQISSSGGCSLDGSLIAESESSVQNGLRTYSPVHEIPPQPNFDDTGMEAFSESLSVLPGLRSAQKIGNDTATGVQGKNMPPECPAVVLRSTENTAQPVQNENAKPVQIPLWLSTTTYQPPRRPKFTSSVGRMFNQE